MTRAELIDTLANIIRKVDGSRKLSAGALAEAIVHYYVDGRQWTYFEGEGWLESTTVWRANLKGDLNRVLQFLHEEWESGKGDGTDEDGDEE